MSESKDPTASETRRAFLRNVAVTGVATGLSGVVGETLAQTGAMANPTSPASKPATPATIALNKQYAEFLSFADTQDFEDAKRGLVATLPEPVIIKGQGDIPAWNLQQFAFVSGGPENNAPPTVNPSLWRNAKLNMNHGLFKVADGIWQVRGYDLSVMSIIRGDQGYIVVDPFITTEVAAGYPGLLRAAHRERHIGILPRHDARLRSGYRPGNARRHGNGRREAQQYHRHI